MLGDHAKLIEEALKCTNWPNEESDWTANFRLACRITDDRVFAKRLWAKTVAWSESKPFAEMDLSEAGADKPFPTMRDFTMEVARELTTDEKRLLRKRLGFK